MTIAKFLVGKLCPDTVTPNVVTDLSELTSQLCGQTKTLSMIDVQRMAQAHYLVVAVELGEGQHIIGMACLVVMDLPQGRRSLVESVAVHVKFRRQGIGQMLMQALAAEATRQGAGPLSLTCNPRRPEARALYEGLGFSMADTAVYRLPLATAPTNR